MPLMSDPNERELSALSSSIPLELSAGVGGVADRSGGACCLWGFSADSWNSGVRDPTGEGLFSCCETLESRHTTSLSSPDFITPLRVRSALHRGCDARLCRGRRRTSVARFWAITVGLGCECSTTLSGKNEIRRQSSSRRPHLVPGACAQVISGRRGVFVRVFVHTIGLQGADGQRSCYSLFDSILMWVFPFL